MPFSGNGDGASASTAYEIANISQIGEIYDYPTAFFKAVADLDLSGESSFLRESGDPNFAGELDLNGYKWLNIPKGVNQFGTDLSSVFGTIDGTIKNGQLDFDVTANRSDQLAPFVNNGTIENVSFTGQITNTGTGSACAYPERNNEGGAITNCPNSINISGAICQLINVIASGATTDKLIYTGQMTDNTGDSSGTKRLANQVFASVTNTFYDITKNPDLVALSGGSSSAEATLDNAGKTTSELQTLATYTDTATAGLTSVYDMVAKSNYVNETWFLPASDYPKLSFEYDAVNLNPITKDSVAQEGVIVDIEVYDDYTKTSGYELITTVTTDVNGIATFFSGDIPAGKKVFIVPHLNDAGTLSSDQGKFVSDDF